MTACMTHTLLRSLMEQRFPTPPGARLHVDASELPMRIQTRLSSGDLIGFSWRSWTAGAETVFMAAKRLFGRGPAARQQVLWAVGVRLAGEDCGRWEYRGGGEWELVVQDANPDAADTAAHCHRPTSAAAVVSEH
jgi:hypothetical protein